MEIRIFWMNIKLSKSDLILDWKLRVISGVSFTLSMMLMHVLIYFSDPEGYRLGLYDSLCYGLSAAIVGGYFGPRIFRTFSEEKPLGKLLKLVFIILICETIIIAFLLALFASFAGTSLPYVTGAFFGIIIVLLVFYGIWRILQITITVGILFLGFRYIRNRGSRE